MVAIMRKPPVQYPALAATDIHQNVVMSYLVAENNIEH